MRRSILFAPMFTVVSYLIAGVLVATFGPLEYQGYQSATVLFYVALVALALSVGYFFGSGSRIQVKPIWRTDLNDRVLSLLFRFSLAISTALVTFELITAILSGGLTFSLSASAEAYFGAYDGYQRNSGSYSARFIIVSLGAFPLFVAQVLGVFYFRTVDKPTRILIVYVFIVTIIVYTLGGGKQKQFGDMMVYVVSVFLAQRASAGTLRIGVLVKVAVFSAAGLCVLLLLLTFRYQAIGISLAELNQNLHYLIRYREGYWMEGILGESISFPIVMFSSYLGQGYFGLSLSLEQPFTWTSFAGSSYSLSVILNQFFGAEFWVERSYPYLVGGATGWAETKWHTVFSWLASDLTFVGVIFFMGFMGFIYGRVWREVCLYHNPFSVMVFAMMNIGWAYAPANNQLMHTPGALSTAVGVLLCYLLLHGNFNAAPTMIRRLRFG